MQHQQPASSPKPSGDGAGAFLKDTAPSDVAFKEAVAAGYEPHDIGLRPLFVFMIGLVATLVVVLMFIYAVMMALTDHDRSKDAIASPVAVNLPRPYAPLQPSLGFYSNHDQDHDTLDAADMILMREMTQKAINGEGVSSTGRHFKSIASAIDTVVDGSLLTSKPALAAMPKIEYPPGSREGVYGSIPGHEVAPSVHENKMEWLNDQGD